MITIISWLWRPLSAWREGYNAHHVNTFDVMLSRCMKTPYRHVCVTDMPEGILCETVPLWEKPVVRVPGSRPNCYKRLYLFSPYARDLFGDRFVSMDLDCIITADLSPIFTDDPFKIVKGKSAPYNGSMWIMDADCRPDVWEDFNPRTSPRLMATQRRECGKPQVGSDQVWMSYKIKEAPTWGEDDGVYQFSKAPKVSTKDARVVFFAGKTKPWHPELMTRNRELYALYQRYSRIAKDRAAQAGGIIAR